MIAYKFAAVCTILGIVVAVAVAHPSAVTQEGRFPKAAKFDVSGGQPDAMPEDRVAIWLRVASRAPLTKQALFSATTQSQPSRHVAVISPLIPALPSSKLSKAIRMTP
jgi:hypothetical protein